LNLDARHRRASFVCLVGARANASAQPTGYLCGRPRLRRLVIRSFQEDASRVGAAVSDSGPGFKDQGFEYLFESYYTTKSHGTGMGLAICRSTIEAHRGRIWAANNPHGGATFQFVIPALAS
jgi:signal transduction histidine kinase